MTAFEGLVNLQFLATTLQFPFIKHGIPLTVRYFGLSVPLAGVSDGISVIYGRERSALHLGVMTRRDGGAGRITAQGTNDVIRMEFGDGS